MRILAVSDVEESWLTTHYDRDRMEGVELIISCGDLPASYLEHIVTLANIPLLYVAGNHDTAYARHAPEGCVNIDGCIARTGRHPSGTRILNACGSRIFEVPDAPGAEAADCALIVRHVARGGLVG